MKYKQLSPYNGDIIETILNGRGVNNIDLFLHPTKENETNLDKISNIEKGLELIQNNIDKKVIVLVDSDCDGISSGSIIYQYLRFINPYIDLDFFVHETKAHGLTPAFMEYVKDKKFDLVIVPDAGSNDIENIEKLENEYKTKVLILDHHEVEEESKHGVIINNQTCEHTNKNLTGAGLTYVFCKALERVYNTGKVKELEDLALIGLVGDGANLKENEVRYICTRTVNNLHNNLIKAFYKIANKELEDLVIKDLSFSGIIPMINAIVRIGTLDEKILLFETISEIDCDNVLIPLEKRKLNKETRKYETITVELDAYEYMVEIGLKVKARQDNVTKKAMKVLEEQYDSSAGVQIFIIEDEDSKGITGLIANKLSNQYQQPCIVVWENDNDYTGSLRGNIKVLPDFKEWCLSTGCFSLVQGHANAAGVILPIDNYNKLKDKSRNIEPVEYCYDVDMIYEGFANPVHITLIDHWRKLWFGGVEEPLFAIENVRVHKSLLVLNKSTMKFYLNGISYIKFRTSEDEYKSILDSDGETIILNIVGKFSVNRWNGKEYPQVMIEDYEIVENTSTPVIYGMFA